MPAIYSELSTRETDSNLKTVTSNLYSASFPGVFHKINNW